MAKIKERSILGSVNQVFSWIILGCYFNLFLITFSINDENIKSTWALKSQISTWLIIVIEPIYVLCCFIINWSQNHWGDYYTVPYWDSAQCQRCSSGLCQHSSAASQSVGSAWWTQYWKDYWKTGYGLLGLLDLGQFIIYEDIVWSVCRLQVLSKML